MLALIVAYDKKRAIGKNGRIPWKIEGEQKRFKDLTMGNTVIMGRRTYEEIGRPLSGRETIVLSKSANFLGENCHTESCLSDALRSAGSQNIYIAGGAGVYEEALPICDKLYITEIDGDFGGDTFFPYFDESLYEKEIVEKFSGDISYTYFTYHKL